MAQIIGSYTTHNADSSYGEDYGMRPVRCGGVHLVSTDDNANMLQ